MCENLITELEIKISYQEDLLETLNNIVTGQQEQIGRLEETCRLLNDKIKNIAEPGNINQGIEIPPHY